MNIIEMLERFRSQADCIAHLENLRFHDKPYCPHCEGHKVGRKKENSLIGRWNCYECGSSFNVLSGTIFEKTKIPLILWFLAIVYVIKSKKGISSPQLSRYIGTSVTTSWRMLNKIRSEMLNEINSIYLSGIVEADESYANIRTDEDWGTGRGSNQLKILGAVERDGQVVARRVHDVTGDTMKWFMMNYLDCPNTKLITDNWKGYSRMNEIVKHEVMTVKVFDKTTSIIEGFWSHIKRALFGMHQYYKPDNADLYFSETCFRYNNRSYDDWEVFDYFVKHSIFKHSKRAYHLLEGRWLL